MDTSSESNWPKIFLIYAIGVLAAMSVSQAVPVVGMIAREFHPTDPSQLGLIISLPSLVVAIGALAVGWLTDKFGARPVLLVGAAILLAGDIATTLAPSFDLLLASRIVAGVGYTGVAVAAVAMLTRTTAGNRRTAALSLWSSFVPMSFIIPFLTAAPVMMSGQWRWAFDGHAIVLAALALLALLFLPEGRMVSSSGARTAGLSQVLRSPWPYALGISFGAAAFLQSGIVASLAVFLARRYHVSELSVQPYNVGAMVANIAGCLAVGRLLHAKIPAVWVGFAGIVLAGLGGVLVFATTIGFGNAIAASWLFTFGCGLLVGMWTLLPLVSPSPACVGATSGLVTQLTLLGVLLGSPFAFAAEASLSAIPMLIFIGGSLVVCLAGLPIWLRWGPPVRGPA